MVEPRQIVREIVDYIGERGMVAGGAIRDILLGLTPTDYDIFVYTHKAFDELIKEKGIFDYPFEPAGGQHMYAGDAGCSFTVYNSKLHGQDVQLIYCTAYEEWDYGDGFPFGPFQEAKLIKVLSAREIVYRFPFMVNMAYADHNRKIVVTEEARYAMKRKEMIFSGHHRNSNSLMPGDVVVEHLYKRLFYLAHKLGYTIPQATLDQICEKYDFYDELSNRVWTKEVPANA